MTKNYTTKTSQASTCGSTCVPHTCSASRQTGRTGLRVTFAGDKPTVSFQDDAGNVHTRRGWGTVRILKTSDSAKSSAGRSTKTRERDDRQYQIPHARDTDASGPTVTHLDKPQESGMEDTEAQTTKPYPGPFHEQIHLVDSIGDRTRAADTHQAYVDDLKSALEKATGEEHVPISAVHSAMTHSDLLQFKLDKSEAGSEDLKARLAWALGEVRSLGDEVRSLSHAADTACGDAQRAETECDFLSKMNQELREQVTGWSMAYSGASEDYDRLDQRNGQLVAQNQTLKDSLRALVTGEGMDQWAGTGVSQAVS